MEPARSLPPLLVGDGTLTNPRDMVRALETVETFAYRYLVDGDLIGEGKATLVRIMADDESASVLVNGCLFLNVASFRYLDFETSEDGRCTVRLHGDGALLTLVTAPDSEAGVTSGQMRLIEDAEFSLSELVLAEDEDEDE